MLSAATSQSVTARPFRAGAKPVCRMAQATRRAPCSVRAQASGSGERLSSTVKKALSLVAAAQLAMLPIAGDSMAALDTKTEKAGVSATIEGSDITNEDQNQVLDKLKNTILPEAKQMLGKVGQGEGSNYPSSIAKELETVETEVNGLIRQAEDGGDMSNVKSMASGIEQQINALKAIVGFD